jgi:hypothetical protein
MDWPATVEWGEGHVENSLELNGPRRMGHFIVMASSCGKPVIDGMGMEALVLGSVDAEVG